MGGGDCPRCGAPLVEEGGKPLHCGQCKWKPGDPKGTLADLKILQRVPTEGGFRERVRKALGRHRDTYSIGGTEGTPPTPPKRKRVQL